MPYLLDADWIIDAISEKRKAHFILKRLIPEGIAVNIVALGEIYERSFRSTNPVAYLEKLRNFLSSCSVINLSDPIMVEFAETRAFLRRQGKLIPDFDLLIGITAVHYDLTLLTFNVRHFNRIPNIRIYKFK